MGSSVAAQGIEEARIQRIYSEERGGVASR